MRDFGWHEFTFLVFSVRWTLALSAISFIGGGGLGLVVLALRVAPLALLRRLAALYIWVMQGTPVLVQLLIIYYGASFIGVAPDAWLAATIAFVLNSSAFFGEIWRGCIEAVPGGQWESARALGFRYLATLRLVVLPQASRMMVAPTVGFMVQVVKGTSVASLIGITELARTAVMVNTVTFEPVKVFGTVALVYFLICWPMSLTSDWLARRMDTKHTAGRSNLFNCHSVPAPPRLAAEPTVRGQIALF
jgi:polar amino acid transport system permease protein